MQRIKSYIISGKGLGFLFLLAAAVLVTMFMMFILKQTYNEVRPQVMLVADEILPITVSGGKIVVPQDVYKRVDIKFGDHEEQSEVFPVVLDTKSENAELPKAKMGLFIMKDVIYWVMEDEVKRYPLHDGEMTKPVLEEKLDTILGMFSLVCSLILILVLFGFSLIEAVVLAGLGGFFLKMNKADDKFSFETRMRLSAVIVAAVEIIGCILSLLGMSLMLGGQFAVALLCVILFLYKEIQA